MEYELAILSSDKKRGYRRLGLLVDGIEGIVRYPSQGQIDLRFCHVDKNSREVLFLFFDIDNVRMEKTQSFAVRDALFEGLEITAEDPHLCVHTGGGLHLYIPITPTFKEDFLAYRKNYRNLVAKLRPMVAQVCPSAVCDEKHEWYKHGRMPGSINGKPERNGAVVTLVSWAEGEVSPSTILGPPIGVVHPTDRLVSRIGFRYIKNGCPLMREYIAKPYAPVFTEGTDRYKLWFALNATILQSGGPEEYVVPRKRHELMDNIDTLKSNMDGKEYLYSCGSISRLGALDGEDTNRTCRDCPNLHPASRMALVSGPLPTYFVDQEFHSAEEWTNKDFDFTSYSNYLQNGINLDWVFFRSDKGKPIGQIYEYQEDNTLRPVGNYARGREIDGWWFEKHPLYKACPVPGEGQSRGSRLNALAKELKVPGVPVRKKNGFNGLAFTNGILTVDEETDEFQMRPIERADYVTSQLPHAFRAGDRHDLVEAFLEHFLGDKDSRARRAYLLCLGLMLTREPIAGSRYQKFFIFYGPPHGGKSAALDLAAALLRFRGGASGGFETLTKKQVAGEDPCPDLSAAHLVTLPEVSKKVPANTGRTLKIMTGEANHTVRVLYTGPVTYQPRGSLVLTTNHYISNLKDDMGILRRMVPVSFPMPFEAKMRELNRLGPHAFKGERGYRDVRRECYDVKAKNYLIEQALRELIRWRKGGHSWEDYIDEEERELQGKGDLQTYLESNFTFDPQYKSLIHISEIKRQASAQGYNLDSYASTTFYEECKQIWPRGVLSLTGVRPKFYTKSGNRPGFRYLRPVKQTEEHTSDEAPLF